MNNYKHVIAVALVGFIIGAVVSIVVYPMTHKGYHEVLKTNIGEFILRECKIYTVYEMQRDMMTGGK